MVDVIPFPCIRPREDRAEEVASLPYDVFSLAEARAEIARHPHSFLRIDMAEATLPYVPEKNDKIIYETARMLLDADIADGTYLADEEPHYYLYRLSAADGTSQVGLVGCVSIDDYLNDDIKKHEKTRADKEIDRMCHVDTCSAHTGPIFLAMRSNGTLEQAMEKTLASSPLYDFTADDGIRHTIWRIDDADDAATIRETLLATPALYIADGHHRAASAVRTGQLRREANQNVQAESGNAPVSEQIAADHFLSVIFPSDQLTILDYNRVVADLNGLEKETFLTRVHERFEVSGPSEAPIKPNRKGAFGMYLDGAWYELAVKEAYASSDPVSGLDVSLLQDNLLAPILGIDDPRTDKRIDFIGGIRGLKELERRVDDGMAVAFALYPTSIDELFSVADAGLLMPPKSTWFEPKLRSGLFIHRI